MLKNNLIRFKDITFNPKTNQINKNDCTIKLTHSESKILKLLLTSPNKVFSKDEIFTYVWEGTASNIGVVPQTISVLRKKLNYNEIYLIETVKKKGYKADVNGTFFEKRKLNKNHLFLSITIIIPFFLSLVAFEKHISNTKSSDEIKIEELMPNVFQTSDSLPFIFDPTVLRSNTTYYINRQPSNLNISACRQIGTQCDLTYNKIIFLQNNESNTVITQYIQDVKFAETMYKDELNTNPIRFNYAARIEVKSENDNYYSGQVIANYNLKQRNNKYVYNKVSIVIDETGFTGQCTYTKESEKPFLQCSEGECTNYVGSISNPKKAVAYKNLFQYPTTGLNILLFPIDDDVSLFYNTESGLSYLVYQYS
ncbi:winged helix family transcriptional regulator [Aliivibrio fischeri]|uniref:winged helix-turn-helix domain-containing protein n=1 Tax=Aliivibrio fischeri TaxID=668 RepID=UPI0012D96D57|nr:winged helix-turn-helix domain-containing protein [Aliivibrio fischeri]MUK36575.1 winged helix family transcriptional regulator [Aliivibrio fischeri]MUL06089.1 winged helix family transcriptional regulator [Aliivibrio fischeri]